MKKFTIVLFSFVLILCVGLGCANKLSLAESVTELQSELYAGQSQSYNLKASYGYKTQNGEKVYHLTVKMSDKTQDNATYTLSLNHNGESYQTTFALNPVSDCLTAKIEVENLTQKTFDVTIYASSSSETVTLSSILPSDTADYTTALNSLLKSQSALISNYCDGEVFTGKIVMRILVKDGLAYWYVGLENERGVKALLIDGKTLEVLAIRDIF